MIRVAIVAIALSSTLAIKRMPIEEYHHRIRPTSLPLHLRRKLCPGRIPGVVVKALLPVVVVAPNDRLLRGHRIAAAGRQRADWS